LLRDAREVCRAGGTARLRYTIDNTERSVGASLAGAVARCHGPDGLNPGAIEARFRGQAGGSFGAFLPRGVRLVLDGVANDYVGKGLSGGELVVRPGPECAYRDQAHLHAILGNTALYGATGGRLYAAGRGGERFAVRNSGATAVIEGLGAHGCEYMTGGTVAVLGAVGDNFGAGMTGGEAYVFDEDGTLSARLNPELVESVALTDDSERAVGLRALVEAHREATGSARAAELLARWDEALLTFRCVRPQRDVAAIEASNEGAEGKAAAGTK